MPRYFCYERNHAMQWIPKLYHDEHPDKTNPLKIESSHLRSTVFRIPDEYTGYSLSDLARRFSSSSASKDSIE